VIPLGRRQFSRGNHLWQPGTEKFISDDQEYEVTTNRFTDDENVTLHDWNEVPTLRAQPEVADLVRRALPGQRMMMLHVFIPRGSGAPRHRHENEQFTIVLSGCLRFRVGSEDDPIEFDAKPGQITHIPSNAWHSVIALEDTLQVDVFAPVHEGLLALSEPSEG
jgi:quercetin dioxygenase-like cupin family protein